MSTFARATILTLLCGIAACLNGAGVPTSQTADQSINGTTVLPATGWGDLGVTSTSATDGSVSWCCTTWFTPLSLGVGDSVGSLTVPVRDNGSANGFAIDGNNVIIVLTAQSSSGSTVLGSITSNGSGNPQTLTLTLSTGYTVPTGVSLVVKAIALTGGAIPGPALHPSTIGAIQVIPPAAQSPYPTEVVVMMPTPFPGSGGPKFVTADNPAGVGLLPVLKSTFINVGGEDFPLPFTSGRTITGLAIELYGQGPGMVEVDLGYGPIDQPSTLIGGSLLLNAPPSWHRYDVPNVTPTLLTSSGHLIMSVDPDETVYIGNISVTFN